MLICRDNLENAYLEKYTLITNLAVYIFTESNFHLTNTAICITSSSKVDSSSIGTEQLKMFNNKMEMIFVSLKNGF